jgi:hypothetical protein
MAYSREIGNQQPYNDDDDNEDDDDVTPQEDWKSATIQ